MFSYTVKIIRKEYNIPSTIINTLLILLFPLTDKAVKLELS